MQFLGTFESPIQTKSCYAAASLFVLKQENSACLLSASTAQETGIINVNLNTMTPEMKEKPDKMQIKSDDSQIYKNV